ncbi:MAG: 4-hydroxy-tetrahydrodipicolinate reductase [Bdellovibrionaceae bacterium]|nr:4-hydroxy-tetrahydrodipicolinate reductase [Bdellovibrio sp.]
MKKTMNPKEFKIGLYGASGKMGQAIEQLLIEDSTLVPYLAIGKSPSKVFSISAKDLNQIEEEILEDIDVWIDFTSAEGLQNLLAKTQKLKTAVVSGSTGLTDKDFANLKKESAKRPLFWASNLSPGLWAFRQAMKSFNLISDFDFAIDETHHTQKKDRPSGTAQTLQADLEKIIQKKIETPASFRLGGVFGIHTVHAASANEVITMQHQALNRSVFAAGALQAARWVVKQKPGSYSMEHLFSNKGV